LEAHTLPPENSGDIDPISTFFGRSIPESLHSLLKRDESCAAAILIRQAGRLAPTGKLLDLIFAQVLGLSTG